MNHPHPFTFFINDHKYEGRVADGIVDGEPVSFLWLVDDVNVPPNVFKEHIDESVAEVRRRNRAGRLGGAQMDTSPGPKAFSLNDGEPFVPHSTGRFELSANDVQFLRSLRIRRDPEDFPSAGDKSEAA